MVVSVNTTVYDDVWSAAVSCSSAMPAFSTFAKFKLSVQKNAGMVAVTLRPFGINSTSYTTANGVLMYTGDNSLAVSTIIDCATDSSQQISIQHHNNPGTVDVSVVGYYIDRKGEKNEKNIIYSDCIMQYHEYGGSKSICSS